MLQQKELFQNFRARLKQLVPVPRTSCSDGPHGLFGGPAQSVRLGRTACAAAPTGLCRRAVRTVPLPGTVPLSRDVLPMRAYIINKVCPRNPLTFVNPSEKVRVFPEKSRGKVLRVRGKFVPLHPLNEEAPREATRRKAFFEILT